MGLIQAALSSVTGTVAEQWKEYFYCDALPSNVIAVKGHKKVSGISSNSGNDNIITDGSVIAVADGQCLLIVEQGKVVDICAEPGEYVYDSSTEPSIFTGNLEEAVRTVFEQIGKRFQYGGQPAEDQRVYYFNTKELIGNKYGTANPIPFRLVDQRANIDLDIGIRCFGEYSLKVNDPILFYTNVCGNFENVYSVDMIADQLKSELLTALQPAFANISKNGLRYSEIPAHTKELAQLLNEELSKEWGEKRGIVISSIGVSSISATEEDEERI
ncbi:MAG: SPFH domain-containing protein, partial [Solobacterium sp.]|nr:SPFH domain-containing protein [Solobacterium sp.]